MDLLSPSLSDVFVNSCRLVSVSQIPDGLFDKKELILRFGLQTSVRMHVAISVPRLCDDTNLGFGLSWVLTGAVQHVRGCLFTVSESCSCLSPQFRHFDSSVSNEVPSTSGEQLCQLRPVCRESMSPPRSPSWCHLQSTHRSCLDDTASAAASSVRLVPSNSSKLPLLLQGEHLGLGIGRKLNATPVSTKSQSSTLQRRWSLDGRWHHHLPIFDILVSKFKTIRVHVFEDFFNFQISPFRRGFGHLFVQCVFDLVHVCIVGVVLSS